MIPSAGGGPPEVSVPQEERARVLLVDDDRTILLGLQRALQTAGFEAHLAENGTHATKLLKERQFDVVVSDISMPGMDGFQLLGIVGVHNPNVPVILMTGAPALETAIKAVEYGAFRYLQKPFDLALFIETVHKAHRLRKLVQLRQEAAALLGREGHQLGDRVALEAAFERALATLWMAYQPIVSVERQSIFAFEALVRCNEPAIPHPAALIGVAERLGRLPELGRTIRRQVASVVADAPSECVFVNLHSRDLLDEELYQGDAPLSRVAKRVVLEITERASLEEVPDSRGCVARLRDLGFRLAIDDLGAGFAGLTAFAQMEPEVVKFDMSLVRGIASSPIRSKLVTSRSGLFREMDLHVVAEGVETAEECQAVTEAGCDLIQGYWFARPGKAFPAIDWDAVG
jgi:EAL domain-containing protein (putative c-di-GMP-specific phosphodiesterase class I)